MLEAGDWQAELRPEIGGALAALRYQGNDALRPMQASSDQPLDASCFPLVPFCNRINRGAFTYDGRDTKLRANHPPESHALHGFGWQQAWRVEQQSSSTARLIHDYDGNGEWPWAYSAEQIILLTGIGLTLELVVSNRADTPAPIGLGLHPYFRRRPETKVQFTAQKMVLTGSDHIPTGELENANHFAYWNTGALLPDHLVDHTFTGWSGTAKITDDLGTIALHADGAPHFHLFAPTDGKTLCCEPVSHAADALNQNPAEMTILPPGKSARLVMHISAE